MKKLMDRAQTALLRLYAGYVELKHRYSLSRLAEQRGAATVEYALLIAAATFMFDPLKEFFLSIVAKIQAIADKEAESNF